REVAKIEGDAAFEWAALSSDGARVAAAEKGRLRVWETEAGRQLWEKVGPISWTRAEFAPGGRRLAAAGVEPGPNKKSSFVVAAWDVDAGTALGRFTADGSWPGATELVFSPDGTRIAARTDRSVLLRSLTTPESPTVTLAVKTAGSGCVTFSPDST